MFCPNCRNQIVDGAEFCPNCGTNLKQVQQQPMNNQPQNNYQQPTNNPKNKKSLIVPVLIVLILIVVAVFGANKFLNKNNDTKQTETVDNNQTIENNDDTTNNSSGDTTGTVDSNTNLNYDKDGAFLMTIEDVFTITGRGTVVTGRVERGTINLNDEVQIIGLDKEIKTTVVTGIEMFRKQLDYAEAGDNPGILLKKISRDEVERGQVLAKPNSIKASAKFEANVYVLSKEEGGRHTPFFNNYRPQFYFRTTDITGTITLPSGVEMVNPGDKDVKMTVELISNVAMEVGTEFSIREGGRTVGKGTVTKVY